MVNDHEPLIVNAIGHLAGAIVFGISSSSLYEVQRDGGRAPKKPAFRRVGRLGLDLECRLLRQPRVDFRHGPLGIGGNGFSNLKSLARGSSTPFPQW